MKHVMTVARITTSYIDIEVETRDGDMGTAKKLALAEAEGRGEFDDVDSTVEFEVVREKSCDGMATTDDRFWDCECEEHYIHPVSENRCSICGCEEVEMPPSRPNEILEYFGCKPEDLVTPVDVKREVLKQKIIRGVNKEGRWAGTTCPGSKGEALGWDQDLHHALEQLLRRGIPGIALSRSVSFECHDWVAVKV